MFIKKAIGEKMQARFVDSPENARIAINTVIVGFSSRDFHEYATTLINGNSVETRIYKPMEFWTDFETTLPAYSKGDADLVSRVFKKC